jgi:NSS family neurotransmitter:Na+ symporter
MVFVKYKNARVLDGVPGSDFGVPVGTRDAKAPNRFATAAATATTTTEKEGDRS